MVRAGVVHEQTDLEICSGRGELVRSVRRAQVEHECLGVGRDIRGDFVENFLTTRDEDDVTPRSPSWRASDCAHSF